MRHSGANRHDQSEGPPLRREARQGLLATDTEDESAWFRFGSVRPRRPGRMGARRGMDAPSPAMASAQNLSFANSKEMTVYPTRSLGEAFRKYRRTEEWARKAPRTREDWWRGWRRIKPVFGDVDPRTVRLDDVSAWRKAIADTVSLREAHRALKFGARCGRSRPRSAIARATMIHPSAFATQPRRDARRNGPKAKRYGWQSENGAWATTASPP